MASQVTADKFGHRAGNPAAIELPAPQRGRLCWLSGARCCLRGS